MGDVIADWPRDRLLGLLLLGRRHGLSEAVLLAGTGLSLTSVSEPGHATTMADEHAVIRNLLDHVSPAVPLALEAGLDFHLVMVGSWGQAIRTSPDLGSAIAFALGSLQAMPSSITVGAAVEGDQLVITFHDEGLPADVRDFILIRNMTFMAMTARELLGHPLPLTSVTARSPRLPYAAALDEFCGVPVVWGTLLTQVVTDVAWLATPLPGADADRHAGAVGESQRMLDRHRNRDGVGARVRTALRGLPASLPTPEVTLTVLAASLELSERTLRRRLTDEGTSFRTLLAQERLTRAQDLLAQGHSIDEVSQRLGYSEPAAFSRAFKRWTGTSPGQRGAASLVSSPPN